MTYDIRSPEYADPKKLTQELERVFDVCHGCRLCHDLCPSFGTVLRRIDEEDGEVARLEPGDWNRVTDECYQCKLCFPKCPYTPPHEWAIDIPRLLLRHKAARVRREGIPLQDQALGRTDLIGTVACATAPVSNWALRNPLNRTLMEATVGIHRLRKLPTYARETFAQWWAKRGNERPGPQPASQLALQPDSQLAPGSASSPSPAAPGAAGAPAPAVPDTVALFYTCPVNYNQPEVGRAAVQVLERNGVAVECPPQRCCGMPYLDGGDLENAKKNAQANVDSLLPAVRRGARVVVPGPTCSYMMKQEYGGLLGTPEAREVASNTMDLFEYLALRHRAGKLDTNVAQKPGKVAYHVPCHLKAQNIGFKSRDVLRIVGAEVATVDKCCGVDGTWGLKKQYYEESFKIAEPALTAFRNAQPATVVTDCPLAAIQIEQGTGLKPRHPIQVLAECYEPRKETAS
ncbi:MAG: heterodisulfide reductase-related iron-sulfur binding cluster [Candidatus Eiseniibacteriota bacterium]